MTSTAAPPLPRLGEELPIFCERCGYSLHGLVQNRCAACDILHFHCPECGHRQPINTLRPAFQRILGRTRAWVLGVFVLFKLFIMFWLLFAWVGMGMEWSYNTEYIQQSASGNRWRQIEHFRPVDLEETTAFLLLGLGYGMFARMLLLRWRRGYLVGAWLAALMFGALVLGIAIRRADRNIVLAWPWNSDFITLLVMTSLAIILGASIVWPIWSGLVHVFLPRRVATAVLDWQSFRPARASSLAREDADRHISEGNWGTRIRT